MLPQFLYKSYNQVAESLGASSSLRCLRLITASGLRSNLDFTGALHHASCRSCEVTAALEDVLYQIKLLG